MYLADSSSFRISKEEDLLIRDKGGFCWLEKFPRETAFKFLTAHFPAGKGPYS